MTSKRVQIVVYNAKRRQARSDFSRAAAFHEAAHAVASIIVGKPPADTQIFANGSGVHWGDWHTWRTAAPSVEAALWEMILVFMAGPHVEARASKRSLRRVRMSNGVKDFVCADQLIEMMVERGYVASKKAGWRKADKHRRRFLLVCWPKIERVAMRLQARGIVRAGELKRICAPRIRQLDRRLWARSGLKVAGAHGLTH